MSAALARFEIVRRSLAFAIRLEDGVTGGACRSPAAITAAGLTGWRRMDGVFIVASAEGPDIDLSVVPADPAFAPRRALLVPRVAAPGQPDPRSQVLGVRLHPSTGYQASANLTLVPCRVVRPSDGKPVALALVRLLPPGDGEALAAAITNLAGDALIVALGMPLVVAGATPSRMFAGRLEVLASLEPVTPAPGVRPIGRPVVGRQKDFGAAYAWPGHLLDPDALLALVADNTKVARAIRAVEIAGGRRNPSITLQLEVPD